MWTDKEQHSHLPLEIISTSHMLYYRTLEKTVRYSDDDNNSYYIRYGGHGHPKKHREIEVYINGLVQDCSISSVLAMEILQSCTKPSIYQCNFPFSAKNDFYIFPEHYLVTPTLCMDRNPVAIILAGLNTSGNDHPVSVISFLLHCQKIPIVLSYNDI